MLLTRNAIEVDYCHAFVQTFKSQAPLMFTNYLAHQQHLWVISILTRSILLTVRRSQAPRAMILPFARIAASAQLCKAIAFSTANSVGVCQMSTYQDPFPAQDYAHWGFLEELEIESACQTGHWQCFS